MIRRLNMELKRERCEGEGKKIEHEEDTLHRVVFTAGTVLLMVCLKRFLVEQWRAWVFLVLNLILLALLFMSMRPSCWTKSSGNNEENKNGKTEIEEDEECYQEQHWTSELQEKEQETEAEEEEVPRLSKEELNQRVEAFIAMFRQHLASDAKQAQTFSDTMPKGFNCLVRPISS